jgi:DNA-binding MarR family transcriptional regulator
MAMEIVKAIRRILRKTAEHSRDLGRTFGLSAPQVLCLRAIAEGEKNRHRPPATSKGRANLSRSEKKPSVPSEKPIPLTVAGLAEAVHMPIATVSRILDRLEQANYIQRQRASDDRRRVHMVLTESGREKLARIPTPLHEEFLAKLQQLDQPSQEAVLAGLRRVVEMMDATDLDVAPVITSDVESLRG